MATDDTIRVLHVDDDPAFADLTGTFLERENGRITVRTATSTDEAIETLAAHDVDCIVSDYDMPGADGIAFLEAIRDTHPDLPFVLFTGKGSEEVAADAIAAGATDYLQKEGGTDQYTVLANRIANAVDQRRARVARRQTEQRLSELTDRSPDVLWMFTADWDEILFVNAAYETVYGRSRERLRSDPRDFLEAIHPDDRDRVLRAMDRLSDGEAVEIEYRVNEAEDYERWVWIRGAPITDDGGTVVRVAGFSREITEHREREQQLRETTSRLEALFEQSPDMINVHDGEGRLLDPNPRLVEETGYDESELTGMKIWELDRAIDPDEAVALWEGMDPGDRERLEGVYRRRDGSTFPVEVHIRRLDLDRDDDRFMAISRDITERTERERERERTIAFLERLYDVATDAELDPEEKITRLLEVGPEELDLPYGYLTRIEVDDDLSGGGTQTIVEASGNHELLRPGASYPLSQSYCRETIGTDGLLEIRDAIAVGMESDPAYETFELGCYIGTTVTVDDELYGTVFFASAAPREAPFSDAERTFVRLMSELVSYELERDRATSELKRQNERLEEFASVVSHDLRNPLNAADGRLELVRADCDSDHLDAIERSHDRMRTLIDDLLALAREDDASLDASVDLGALVESSWQTVETGEATLVVDVDRPVRADESRLRQLLENLLRNAVEHGGEDVTVVMGELETGFYVEDDGAGIPENDREEVFQPDYSTSERGTGVGLSIVTRVAEAHNWAVDAVEGSDGGARFEITDVEFATG